MCRSWIMLFLFIALINCTLSSGVSIRGHKRRLAMRHLKEKKKKNGKSEHSPGDMNGSTSGDSNRMDSLKGDSQGTGGDRPPPPPSSPGEPPSESSAQPSETGNNEMNGEGTNSSSSSGPSSGGVGDQPTVNETDGEGAGNSTYEAGASAAGVGSSSTIILAIVGVSVVGVMAATVVFRNKRNSRLDDETYANVSPSQYERTTFTPHFHDFALPTTPLNGYSMTASEKMPGWTIDSCGDAVVWSSVLEEPVAPEVVQVKVLEPVALQPVDGALSEIFVSLEGVCYL